MIRIVCLGLFVASLGIFTGCRSNGRKYTPVKVSFWKDIAIPPGDVYGLQLGMPVAWNREDGKVKGVDLSLISYNRKTTGLQLNGIFGNSRYFSGIQFGGGICNYSKRISGFQLGGGICNYAKRLTGLQLGGGICNYTKRLNGAQIGTVNVKRSRLRWRAFNVESGFQLGAANYFDGLLDGVQIGAVNRIGAAYAQFGVINYARKQGLQFGLINIIRDGWLPFMIGCNFDFTSADGRLIRRQDDLFKEFDREFEGASGLLGDKQKILVQVLKKIGYLEKSQDFACASRPVRDKIKQRNAGCIARFMDYACKSAEEASRDKMPVHEALALLKQSSEIIQTCRNTSSFGSISHKKMKIYNDFYEKIIPGAIIKKSEILLRQAEKSDNGNLKTNMSMELLSIVDKFINSPQAKYLQVRNRESALGLQAKVMALNSKMVFGKVCREAGKLIADADKETSQKKAYKLRLKALKTILDYEASPQYRLLPVQGRQKLNKLQIALKLKPERNWEWLVPSVNMQMVYVATDKCRAFAALEKQKIEPPNMGYWIGRYEVTREQYFALTGKGRPDNEEKNLPTRELKIEDIIRFCVVLNVRERNAGRLPEGYEYRLPYRNEWMFAAIGGIESRGYKFSGGDNIDQVAWFRGNSRLEVHPVGTKLPNELGIHDMSGNLCELCMGYELRMNYSPRKTECYWGKMQCKAAGGSVCGNDKECLVAKSVRGYYSNNVTGFRVVLAPAYLPPLPLLKARPRFEFSRMPDITRTPKKGSH